MYSHDVYIEEKGDLKSNIDNLLYVLMDLGKNKELINIGYSSLLGFSNILRSFREKEFIELEMKRLKEIFRIYGCNPHHNFGILLQNLDIVEKVEEEFKEAIRINPNNASTHYNLGVLLDDLERYREAEEEYKEAIRIKPNYVFALYNLGILLDKFKKYEEAEDCYRKVIAINPKDALARNNLGYLLKRLKNYREAETEFRAAIEINPKEALTHQNLAELYFIQKDYENSLEIAEEALINASKIPYEKIISNFLILINLIALGRNYEIDEFIKFLKENNRYGQTYTYHFDEIKNAAYGLEYKEKILDLINKMEELKG